MSDPKSTNHETNIGAFKALKALQSVGGLNWGTILLTLPLIMLVGLTTNAFQWLLERASELLVLYFYPIAPKNTLTLAERNDLHGQFTIYVSLFLLLALVFVLVIVAKRILGEKQPRVHVSTGFPAKVLMQFMSCRRVSAFSKFMMKETKKTTKSPLGQKKIVAENYHVEELLKLVSKHVRLLPYNANGFRMVSTKSKKSMPPYPEDERKNVAPRKLAYEIIDFPKQGYCSFPDKNSGNIIVRIDQLAGFFDAMPWRMNVEGLRPHIFPGGPIKALILIPSSSTAENPGSVEWLEPVKQMLYEILKQHGHTKTKIYTPDKFDKSISKTNAIDYYQLPKLVDLLYKITRHAKKTITKSEDKIVVDITSGNVLCSAAGLSFATLVDRRKVQYVSTETYTIQNYDVTHDVDLN